MAYTTKELAKISGISVRTLHWHDEIGANKNLQYSNLQRGSISSAPH